MKKVEEFYAFKIKAMWQHFRSERFAFWMICCYLFFEYVRPQSIYPAISFLPWAQLFIILAFIAAFTDKSIKWAKSPINLWMIAFSIAIFFSSLTAFSPEMSKKHYIDLYPWILIYFLIINIVNTRERLYIFLMLFVVAAGKIAVGTTKIWAFRGFTFSTWGLSGPAGYFQNSGELSILMLTLFPLVYKLFEALKDRVGKLERYLLMLLWITPIMTILGASSRGAQIALAVQMAIMFRNHIFRAKTLAAIVALGLATYNLLPEEQKARFENIGEDKTSMQRLLYWENGINMMKEHPLLGVGFFNFPIYYDRYYPEDVLYEQAELPHNIIIQVGTDAGLVGLIPFLMINILCLRLSSQVAKNQSTNDVERAIAAGLGYGIVGFFVAGQFVTVAYYPFLWIGAAQISALWVINNGSTPTRINRNS